jgi:chromosome segregation ATPase
MKEQKLFEEIQQELNTISEKIESIRNLKNEFETFKNEILSKDAELKINDATENRLSNIENIITGLENKVNVQNQNNVTQILLENSVNYLENKTSDLQNILNEINEEKITNESLNNTTTILEDKFKSALNEIKNQIETYKYNLDAKSEKKETAINNLKQLVGEFENKFNQNLNNINKINTEIIHISKNIRELKEIKNKLFVQITDTETKYDNLNTQIDFNEKNIKDFNVRLIKIESEIKKISQLETNRLKISELEQTLIKLNGEIENAKQEYNLLKNKLEPNLKNKHTESKKYKALLIACILLTTGNIVYTTKLSYYFKMLFLFLKNVF